MNPMERPSFTDLAKRLNSLLQDKTKYVNYLKEYSLNLSVYFKFVIAVF